MSILNSRELTEEEIDELKENTIFTESEIELLFYRFNYLDRGGCGYLTFAEFQMIPEFHGNPFGKQILGFLEECSGYERINFATFLEFLSVFSDKTEKRRRIGYLFSIFDIEKSGKLTKAVLLKIAETMTGRAEEEEADAVLRAYDRGGKGFLSREDFERVYESDPGVDGRMVIDFSRSIGKDPESVWDVLWPINKTD